MSDRPETGPARRATRRRAPGHHRSTSGDHGREAAEHDRDVEEHRTRFVVAVGREAIQVLPDEEPMQVREAVLLDHRDVPRGRRSPGREAPPATSGANGTGHQRRRPTSPGRAATRTVKAGQRDADGALHQQPERGGGRGQQQPAPARRAACDRLPARGAARTRPRPRARPRSRRVMSAASGRSGSARRPRTKYPKLVAAMRPAEERRSLVGPPPSARPGEEHEEDAGARSGEAGGGFTRPGHLERRRPRASSRELVSESGRRSCSAG